MADDQTDAVAADDTAAKGAKAKAPAAPVPQEMASIRPTGVNPSQPQGVPGGAFHIGDQYVEPLAQADRYAGKLEATQDGQKIPRAPFRFVDGSLQPNLANVYVPETINADSLAEEVK